MASQIRIRNGTVNKINISEDKIKKLNSILDSKKFAPFHKEKVIKEITGRCCVCGNVAIFEVAYPLEGATRIERYCEKCVKSLYEREPVL